MANYQQTDVIGTSWVRCEGITIRNPYQQAAEIFFIEERLTTAGSNVIHEQAGSCSSVYAPDGIIELRDPATGIPTGESITHDELYVIMYSAYMQSALKRDADAALLAAAQNPPTP